MNKFKIILVCLILCLFMSLSAVAAADSDLNDTDKNLLSVNDVSANPLSLTNDDMVSVNENSESFTELKNLVTGGGEISLTKNYTYSSSDSMPLGITITKDVTITGNGNVIIDADSKARIFNIQGATVTLKGITFTNGRVTGDADAGTGGAIFLNSQAKVIIDNCSFTNNFAKTYGGAISLNGVGSVINNTYFYKNRAEANTNGIGGGAINIVSSASGVVIDNCSFISNSHKYRGGAISSQYAVDLTINNSYFYDNIAEDSAGGALFFEYAKSNIMLFNNTFESNVAKKQFGGAIQFNGNCHDVTFKNSTFLSNMADRGGAIRFDNGGNYASTDFKFINIMFIDNHAKYEGGGYSDNQGASNFYFENVTFINCTNTNGGEGGGAHFKSANSQYYNLTFINSSASTGGSIDWYQTYGAKTVNIRIINSSSTGYGGAIAVRSASNINSILANVTIINSKNTGINGGGAIHISAGTATLSNINIINSSSTSNGGAIYLASKAYVHNINITNTTTTANGGAFYISSQNNEIYNVKIINSSATATKSDGGAIYIHADHQDIKNITIENTSAKNNGGAVYIGNYNYVYLDNLTVNRANAKNGGGVYYAGYVGSIVYIRNSNFIKNIVTHNGGAIYYTLEDGQSTKPVVYRDYNKFDGDGQVDGGKTTVDMKDALGSTYVKHIYQCLFEENEDYLLNISSAAATDTLMAVVNISNPNDPNKNSFRVVVNVTKGDELVTQLILNTTADYNTYFNQNFKKFIMNIRNNLTGNSEYDVTVGFEDNEYLYKEAKSSFEIGDIRLKGDFLILQDLINQAIADGKDLILPRSFEFTAKEDHPIIDEPDVSCMNITSPITIYGNGYTLNALGYSRIFNITAGNVVLDGINFVNGNANGKYGTQKYNDEIDYGGAIFWAGKNGVLNNSAIRYSNAEYGGGIYFNVTASDCSIINSTFVENIASENGGAIDCNASKMRLYNTTFESNVAKYGAALSREINASGGSGKNNTFLSNHATIAGAALAWRKAQNIYIDDYKFIDNTAAYSGGAIYIHEGSTNCTVAYSYFAGNNVTSSTEGHGGAIEWYAVTGNIINSTFINNNAYTGGAIYVGSQSGHINITQSGFLRNTAITIGGAIDLVASSVSVNNTYFRENTAAEGGAIFVGGTGENNFINSSYFTNNVATYGKGGAINWNASAGQIFNTNFTQNSAYYGGAVYIGGNSDNSQITNVTFTANNATFNGGAIDWNATGGQLYNTTFISNYAGEYGAALCRESGATGGSCRYCRCSTCMDERNRNPYQLLPFLRQHR